ncbi:MAG: response regulator transcription factor [Clostridiales bacterium]|nr:response regulator transcription factor [Clostridiales bacterium]
MLQNRLMILNQKEEENHQMTEYFEESGYSVICCTEMNEVIRMFSKRKHKPELFIFCMQDSNRQSYEVIDNIRKISDMAIIIVSEDGRLDTQLYVYSKKIDDYMVAPVPLPLLEAHVEAVFRRFSDYKISVENVGAMTIDYEGRKIYLAGEPFKVTAKEYDLMEYFIRHKGMVLSRDKILDSVWGYDYIGGYRSVDTLVKKLRAKLTKEYPYIQTIYGVGYCFDEI